MSWSVSYTGTSDAVAAEIESQFDQMSQYPCPEPEEAVKQHARVLIAAALAANQPARLVTVGAWGSQSLWEEGGEARFANSLSITIS
jgi:hypothetical protein